MSRVSWRSLASLLVLALLGGCGEDIASSPGPRANSPAPRAATPSWQPARGAILITVDTLRADALGFMGNARAATPTLDRLAHNGVVFEQARAHSVMTLPSHASMLTGRYPFDHGVRDNAGFVLSRRVKTIASILKEAGFATAGVVGAFPLDTRFGLHRGFDLYDDGYPEGGGAEFLMAERSGREVVEQALEWWRSKAGQRRFLWLHLFDPHAPYAPPEPWASRFADNAYLGEVAAVDAYLKPLLESFLGGEEEPTLILFTSDHGEALGDHGELTHGLFTYEATLRVPLVLWLEGLTAQRSSFPARHVDVLPTMLAALGVEDPDERPGRSLLGLPAADAPDVVQYFEALGANLNRDWAPLRGVVRESVKYIDLPEPELYDLRKDPEELHNLARELPGLAEELAGLIPSESQWPPVPGQISVVEERALRALGYLSGVGASGRSSRSYDAGDDPKNLVEIDRKIHRFIELYQLRRLSEAVRVARQIVDSQPQMAAGHYHLAQVLLEQGEVEEALEVMARAYERGVSDGKLLRQLALTLTDLGQPQRALEILSPHARSEDPEMLNTYALVLSETGDQALAQATLERIFEVDARNPTAHQNLALVAYRLSRWRECAAQARSALDLNDGLPLAWNYLGLALYELGQRQDAVAAWQRAVELAPGDFDLLYNLGAVSAELGQRDLARRTLIRFIDSAPVELYRSDLAKARARLRSLDG